MPRQEVVIGVVVPAHDEQELLPACLASVERARRAVTDPVVVVVALDRCTDATAAVVPPGVRTVTLDAGNVGLARAAGCAAALAGLPTPTWLACTDADGTVDPDWLRAHAAHARSGVAAVAGTVRVADFPGQAVEVGPRWRSGYSPTVGHGHVHGANLGVRADVYCAVGGFAPLAVHEDVDLLARVAAAEHVVRGVTDLGVTTSGRATSRAPGGFAEHLRGLADPVAP